MFIRFLVLLGLLVPAVALAQPAQQREVSLELIASGTVTVPATHFTVGIDINATGDSQAKADANRDARRADLAEAFLKTTGGDPEALLHLLDTFVDTTRAQLAAVGQPVLVLSGKEDADNGSHQALAEALPDARLAEVPGGHMSAVLRPELGQAIADFLAA